MVTAESMTFDPGRWKDHGVLAVYTIIDKWCLVRARGATFFLVGREKFTYIYNP